MSSLEEIIAEQQAQRRRKEDAARRRFTLFVLESVGLDGLPRVSRYTVETFRRQGLIEPVGDNEQHWRLTAEGRIMLAANPADVTPSDELALFGGLG